jgi:hypothetical protein
MVKTRRLQQEHPTVMVGTALEVIQLLNGTTSRHAWLSR